MDTKDYDVGSTVYFLDRDQDDSYNPPNNWCIRTITIKEKQDHWWAGNSQYGPSSYGYNWDLFPTLESAKQEWLKRCDQHIEACQAFRKTLEI